MQGWDRETICRVAAETELKNGMFVNLGIGLPTNIPNYIPKGQNITFQSENGMLGIGPFPLAGDENPDLINAGKQTITEQDNSSYFNSAESFAMIRGSHIDLTVLGALQVASNGDLANWTIPGKMMKGMGGAMDLVANVKRVVVTMDHTAKDGSPKLVSTCDLPLTGQKVVQRVITNFGVFDCSDDGFIAKKLAEGITRDIVEQYTDATVIF